MVSKRVVEVKKDTGGFETEVRTRLTLLEMEVQVFVRCEPASESDLYTRLLPEKVWKAWL